MTEAHQRPAPTLGVIDASADRVLVTGGAGFVGTNLAARLLDEGRDVVVLDNLSRAGVERNLQWLRDTYGSRLQMVTGDVRDADVVREAMSGVRQVFHFAAQVAVTTSLSDPVADFEINLRGTLNVLEAARRSRLAPSLVFTSTNKVYGDLGGLEFEVDGERYRPVDETIAANGVPETEPLDFCSPYGCSKGGADQYVLDYTRSYDLPAVVLRMSCIYGPHQFGNEDQGWVAHFLIRAMLDETITLYGDGRQVRDVLFVGDLVEAMLLCQQHMPQLSGRAFNIGGGTGNTVSLRELLAMIGQLRGSKPSVRYAPWRVGDQRYYVSDTRAFAAATGWRPQMGIEAGVQRLHEWLRAHHGRAAEPLLRTSAA